MKEPSPRRFALWAVSLVLPLILGAVALPYVRRWAAPAGRPGEAVSSARETARSAEGAAAASARQADASLAEGQAGGAGGATPPRRDGPTAEEIEASRAAEVALAEAERGWKKVEVLAPRQAQADASGDLIGPFQGFGLSVDSKPSGARVLVAGRDQGETPLLTTVDCKPGALVAVRLERKGHRPFERTVRCRADTLVGFTATLGR